MRPLFAPVGTAVTILVAVAALMVAVVPAKVALLAFERLIPLIVTVVPGAPEVGVKLRIWGVTVVVIRPIELLLWLVNHNAPSGPATIPSGPRMPVPV